MACNEPAWWYRDGPHWQASLLRPISHVYGVIAQRRFFNTKPYRSRLPVICVGNFTAGGTGKTPMSLLIASIIEAADHAPWFLSRGYGGRLDGQERIDPARHAAADTGDEPLLLAARAPTVISRDRALGAEFIERQAPRNAVIIMDDGLQNASLAKDLTIAIVDGNRGFGNGAVIPAGPLRAQLAFQVPLADVIIINGTDGNRARQQLDEISAAKNIPQLSAKTVPTGDMAWLKNAKVVAYAGVANPDRFFRLLESLGANIVERVAFNDHQTLPNEAAEDLIARAANKGATLVTTEKDYVRLAGLDRARVDLKARSKTLPIVLQMPGSDRAILAQRIATAIAKRAEAAG